MRTRIDTRRERWRSLVGLEAWLETPMIVLSLVWLALVIAEFVWGERAYLSAFGWAIWAAFVVEFALRLTLAPDKVLFVRKNAITVIALLVPAVRLFRAVRVLRLARAARGLTLVKAVGTANRVMNALRRSLKRRGLGYVLGATVVVEFLGAAGMYALERAPEVEGGFVSYADALWWTAMILTTMGSGYWPQTGEGRLLALLLSIYSFTVFGYITASFASFFVGEDRNAPR